MKTAVVILNWNGRDFLKSFLPGLVSSLQGTDAEVIIADNASTDGSLELLESDFPELRTLVFDRNYGFTGGYNRAFKELEADSPEYFLLINSDIEVTPDWYYPLEEWMDLHDDCAACAPKLHAWQEGRRDVFEYAGAAGGWLDRFGYPFCRGRVMKRVEEDRGQYDYAADVLWATGACLMVRSSAWKQLGGLDERFFAHMEEIDFCWRARLAGWRVNVVPRSLVYHVGGGTLPQDSPRKLFLNYRNNLLMLRNNLAKTYAMDEFYATLAVLAPDIASGPDGIRSCIEVMDGMENNNIELLCRDCARHSYNGSKRLIFKRMILDGMSACVYLLQGRKDYFNAVVRAHKDYRRLRQKPGRDKEIESLTGYLKQDVYNEGRAARRMLDIDLDRKMLHRVHVKGILDESVILLNYTKKESIFEYLRNKTE